MIGRIFAAACWVLLGAGAAYADYPDHLIKLIVPAPPGGQTDVLARFLAQTLQTALHQTIVVENRAGAGGGLGARAAAAAAPDGYTLFFGNTSTLAVIPAVSRSAGYDPVKDFTPIASVSESYMILVVSPSSPLKDVPSFVAYAKAHPGKLNFAFAGAGNVTHLTGEMFKALAGIDFLNVPYPGGAESVTAVIGRQVDFALESPVILLPLIQQGTLRGLAVTSASRQAAAPAIPTMVESGIPGFVATLLTGVVAPAHTPPDIVARLNGVINDALRTEEMRSMLARYGSTPRIGSPDAFADFLAGETRKWSGVAKAAHVEVD